ncbi:hypothetical protein E1211_11945 [Micromonospora sp. 15K316]|uniref:hypothetical protein n=1 Tax=Micromonospora sp. 15K316 TaxID=2530376 RepID=UPI00104C8713|nr:hypothetical protein [Micromonospora sp. 15K316]TDC36914.1 hypothetical protein E1211_11945 [Micromonospora sp. 15K316]
MAKHRHVPGDDPLNPEEAAETPAYWSVDDSRWPAVRPDLPRDVADLLAPPIVVGVARVAATSRLTPPGAAPARNRRTPSGAVPTPALLAASNTAPTPVGRIKPASVNRPAGASDPSGPPAAAGRHRRNGDRRF